MAAQRLRMSRSLTILVTARLKIFRSRRLRSAITVAAGGWLEDDDALLFGRTGFCALFLEAQAERS